MRHAIWPEGLPQNAYHTTSGFRAFVEFTRQQFAWMLPLPQARRIRHARSEGGAIDPTWAETALQEAGAIPPPGGWSNGPPGPRPKNEDSGRPVIEAHVHTHSVL